MVSRATAVDAPVLFTIGHSTRTFDELVEVLASHGVKTLVDVRTIPRSRRVPQFNSDALARELPKRGIKYLHMSELGGLRKPVRDSINVGWRNASFRGYADYMQTKEFASAIEKLEEIAGKKPTAIMCAEAVPWRCHRSLIGDAMLARKWRVLDLMTRTTATEHKFTPFAKVRGKKVTYPTEEKSDEPGLFDESGKAG